MSDSLYFFLFYVVAWKMTILSQAAVRLSPKCSANPITVSPIWKWESENKEHPIRGLYRTFLKNLFSNFLSHIKDSKWGSKCIFINCTSCNGSPQQIPFQFANGKLPHSRCRAFQAQSSKKTKVGKFGATVYCVSTVYTYKWQDVR